MADACEDILHKIVSHFSDGVALAFAYGSGVFKQQGNVSAGNMIDFVFVVEDSRDWHKNNLKSNPGHYSSLGRFGCNAVVTVQDRFGAGVYYNTLVPCEGRVIKYGTIDRSNFLRDMNDWEWLYISGRLHKPVQVLAKKKDSEISSALKTNLSSAVSAALLCLPESFTEEDFYMNIAGLSYAGDFRMIIGEDRSKVQNLVRSNLEAFRELYTPLLTSSTDLHYTAKNSLFNQNTEADRTYALLKSLPRKLQRGIFRSVKVSYVSNPESVPYDIAKDRAKCSILVRQGVASIVRSSSISQSAKGVLSAGFLKTCVYSGEKLRKMLRGLLRK